MPDPNPGETREQFISRCMGDDEARQTFPDRAQRYRFCESQWERREGAGFVRPGSREGER